MRRGKIKTKKVLLLTTVVLAVVACSSFGKTIYVDDDAHGLGDGSSWENAFNYLQDALAAAKTMGQPVEVRVAQGIYRPDQGVNQIAGDDNARFELVEGVVLKGGYAGVLAPDPNARDVHRCQTTLSGDLLGNDVSVRSPQSLLDERTREDNSRNVVTGVRLSAATVLDGFTITGASHPWMLGRADSWGGAGVYLSHASPILADCRLQGNFSRGGSGGALMNYGGGEPTVINCIFSGNLAGYGGAIANWPGGNTKVINCTFHNNWASRGGAIFNRCVVSNSILWGNVPDEIGATDGGPDITYSDVTGGWPGEGNLDMDPCFADPGYRTDNGTPGDLGDDISTDGDYHLKSQAGRWDPNSQSWVIDDVTSPCMDAGDPNGPVGEEPQPNGGRINMGAYGGTAEASKSVTSQGSAVPHVVYIFSSDAEAAGGFESLLEGYGCSVRVVVLKDVTAGALADCDVIVVGNDTGYLSGWGTVQSVAAVKDSGKPVIGLGEGGYALFGKLGLAIGHPNGGHANDRSIYVVDPEAALFAGPNAITIGQDRILQLYSETADVSIYLLPIPATVVPFGSSATGSRNNYPLVLEAGRYLLWGFTEPPERMTQNGNDLFINAVVLAGNGAWGE
jgi:hypothetical protein